METVEVPAVTPTTIATIPGMSTHAVQAVSGTLEESLGAAIREAAAAGQWSLVAQLARELEARRQCTGAAADAQAADKAAIDPDGAVIDLSTARKRRT